MYTVNVDDIHSRSQRYLMDDKDKDNDMVTLSIPELIQLTQSAIITADSDLSDDLWSPDGTKLIGKQGWISNTLTADSLTITYQAQIEHPKCKPSEVVIAEDSFNHWMVDEIYVSVIDENGHNLDEIEICEIIAQHTKIQSLDPSVLGEDEIKQIDIEKDSEMLATRRAE